MNNQPPLIRQGWLRALIFLIIFIIVQGAAGVLANLVLKSLAAENLSGSVSFFVLSLIGLLSTVPAVYVFRRFIDRKSFTSLGFTWTGNTRHAWTGFFGALLILSLGCLVLMTAGDLTFIGFDFSAKDFLVFLITMLIVAISEELVIRGYILNNLMESINKWAALFISASVFALLHFANPDFSWVGLIGIFLGGLLLGINYIYTKNLWYSIFFHFSWNFFQGPVFGFKVSGIETRSLLVQNIKGPVLMTGGAFGFEASVLAFLLILLFTIGLGLYYYRNRQEFVAT